MESERRKKIWSKAAILKLIDLWKLHPCLYDSKNQFYYNKQSKNKSLAQITQGLKGFFPNLSEDDVKMKYQNMRNQYNCYKLKGKLSSLYWYNNFQFIEKYIKPRKVKTKNWKINEPPQSMFEEIKVDCEDTRSRVLANSDDSISVFYPLQRENKPLSSTPLRKNTNMIKRKRKYQDLNIEQKILLRTSKAIKSMMKNSKSDRKFEYDIEMFGECIKAELNKIKSESLRDEARKEILITISNIKKKNREL